jgi:hypothetical protein
MLRISPGGIPFIGGSKIWTRNGSKSLREEKFGCDAILGKCKI